VATAAARSREEQCAECGGGRHPAHADLS